MWLANLLVQNIPNIQNLALLICHLFIGGSFRYGEILYDPHGFQDHLGTKVDSVCPVHIPWQQIDITRVTSSIRQLNERTDHILQLFFFDSKHPPQNVDKFIEHFTYYQVFVFLSNNNIEMKESMKLVKKMSTLNSNSVSVYCNTLNGSIHIHLNNGQGEITEIDNKFTLFDRLFGEYEKMQPTTIKANRLVKVTNGHKVSQSFIRSEDFETNLLFTSLNVSYVNLTSFQYVNITLNTTQRVVPKKRRFYKELSLEYDAVDNSNA